VGPSDLLPTPGGSHTNIVNRALNLFEETSYEEVVSRVSIYIGPNEASMGGLLDYV
jgi:hypothetical protein